VWGRSASRVNASHEFGENKYRRQVGFFQRAVAELVAFGL
jgi:hypothetical protein